MSAVDLTARYLDYTIRSAQRRTTEHLESILRTVEGALRDVAHDRLPSGMSSIPNDLAWALQATKEWECLVEVAGVVNTEDDK